MKIKYVKSGLKTVVRWVVFMSVIVRVVLMLFQKKILAALSFNFMIDEEVSNNLGMEQKEISLFSRCLLFYKDSKNQILSQNYPI
jgi:hypothetical protein